MKYSTIKLSEVLKNIGGPGCEGLKVKQLMPNLLDVLTMGDVPCDLMRFLETALSFLRILATNRS